MSIKNIDDIRDIIAETCDEDVLLFDNPSYATAFVGVTEDNRAVYDYEKMLIWLIQDEGMSINEAIDFIDYNTIRSLPYYDDAPIILHTLI